MKAVLMSVQPKWCELIANGKKTIEIRKTKPNLKTPFKVYIYCTKGKLPLTRSHRTNEIYLTHSKYINRLEQNGNKTLSGKVIGEFVCNKVNRLAHCGNSNSGIRLRITDESLYCKDLDYEFLNKCKLFYLDIDKYSNGRDVYGWHISDLVIYDKPKELSEFSGNSSVFTFDNNSKIVYTGLKRPPQSWCYVEEIRSDNNAR